MIGKWKIAGDELRKLRKETKLSVFKVARKVFISGNYLSLIERGIHCPSDIVLLNLAEFYEVDAYQLFKLYNKVVPPNSEQLKAIPSLKQIMIQISIDSKLTQDGKERLSNSIYQIVNELIGEE